MSSQVGNKLRREKSYPHCGRLVIFSSQSQTRRGDTSNEGDISIEFPAMPDSVELARTATYNVTPNFVMPDAIHMYKHTEAMQIPFSFSLHAFDSEYCKHGAMTLLEVAARLHSLVLPISKKADAITQASRFQGAQGATEKVGNTPGLAARAESSAGLAVDASSETYAGVSPPVTCRLELFYTDEGTPGLVCIGYVKDVKAVLKGPWLRGPGRSFNLPSAGDFSFTFMHRPGHSNNWSYTQARQSGNSAEPQAYAGHVLRNLYNNRQLVASTRGFVGLEEEPKVAPVTARTRTDTENEVRKQLIIDQFNRDNPGVLGPVVFVPSVGETTH